MSRYENEKLVLKLYIRLLLYVNYSYSKNRNRGPYEEFLLNTFKEISLRNKLLHDGDKNTINGPFALDDVFVDIIDKKHKMASGKSDTRPTREDTVSRGTGPHDDRPDDRRGDGRGYRRGDGPGDGPDKRQYHSPVNTEHEEIISVIRTMPNDALISEVFIGHYKLDDLKQIIVEADFTKLCEEMLNEYRDYRLTYGNDPSEKIEKIVDEIRKYIPKKQTPIPILKRPPPKAVVPPEDGDPQVAVVPPETVDPPETVAPQVVQQVAQPEAPPEAPPVDPQVAPQVAPQVDTPEAPAEAVVQQVAPPEASPKAVALRTNGPMTRLQTRLQNEQGPPLVTPLVAPPVTPQVASSSDGSSISEETQSTTTEQERSINITNLRNIFGDNLLRSIKNVEKWYTTHKIEYVINILKAFINSLISIKDESHSDIRKYLDIAIRNIPKKLENDIVLKKLVENLLLARANRSKIASIKANIYQHYGNNVESLTELIKNLEQILKDMELIEKELEESKKSKKLKKSSWSLWSRNNTLKKKQITQ